MKVKSFKRNCLRSRSPPYPPPISHRAYDREQSGSRASIAPACRALNEWLQSRIQFVKLLKRLLLGLGFAALIGHSVYLSVRVHELDLRLQAADQRPAVTGNGLVNMNATTLTTAFEAAPVQP